MAYKWDEKGNIVGEGLPGGMTINLDSYNNALSQYTKARSPVDNYYTSMKQGTSLGDSVEKFQYRNGKLQGFIPEVGNTPSNIAGFKDTPKLEFGKKQDAPGVWVDIGGIQLDASSLSGQTSKALGENYDISFRDEGGAPLAVFGNDLGYMRLATQQAKYADNLRLGNQSGTASGTIRQNAQRRTLL